MSGGRGAGESDVWRKGIAGLCVSEMFHPQNKFRILSVEILSQQRDILSYSWMPAHVLPQVSLNYAVMRGIKTYSVFYVKCNQLNQSVTKRQNVEVHTVSDNINK